MRSTRTSTSRRASTASLLAQIEDHVIEQARLVGTYANEG
jgi:phosphatidylethanolamine-binding protein (PEBP) family uncharacterized protein